VIEDQNQNIVWRWDNTEPFGDSVPNDDPNNMGSHFDFPLALSLYYRDKETATFYANQRDAYDPGIGRFPQFDPIGLAAGSLSPYIYVDNNPLSFVDPDGLMGFGGGGSATTARPMSRGNPNAPSGPSAAGPAGPAVPGVSCNGYWKYQGYDEQLPKIMRLCSCYWLCMDCNNPVVWSGNKRDLPSTTGQLFYDSNGGALKGGNQCLCKNKPGPETGCTDCEKNKK